MAVKWPGPRSAKGSACGNCSAPNLRSIRARTQSPFLADQLVTGDNTPVSQHLPDFLAAHAALWRATPAYFLADSASSEGQHLDLARAQSPKWSVSYNRWTEPLERAAAALPASARTAVSTDGHYAYVRHQPAGCPRPQV